MTTKMRVSRALGAAIPLIAGASIAACAPAGGSTANDRVARNTLVVGIDVSGSFLRDGRYESTIDFMAN